MDMFEKAGKAAKNVGETVISSAKNIGTTIYSSTKEQGELAGLHVQKAALEKKLSENYTEIGKKYVEYVENCDTDSPFSVDDIMDKMKDDLEKLAEVKAAIAEKEKQVKQKNEEKLQKKAQDEFETEKKKLEKALELDVISEEEFEEKLEFAKRKLENYAKIRKIEMQLSMGIISSVEYEEKLKKILS